MTVNTPTIPPVFQYSVSMGADPEFFLRHNGEVIGAEKVIPAVGLAGGMAGQKIVIDGVQAELNVYPNTCRESLSVHIGRAFVALDGALKLTGKGYTADFSRAVEISQEKLDELSDDSKKFGCSPSSNIYRTKQINIDTIDPLTYRVRAAGGHLHLGAAGSTDIMRAFREDHKKTVALLDLICGNTSVLVDRDPANVERRKLYGRAGEYRLPEHGLEYRTLSNYWLHSVPLMSLATGLARHAICLMVDKKHNYYGEFTSLVSPKKIRAAINNNDFDQAMENFEAIKTLLIDSTKQKNPFVTAGFTGAGGRVPIDIDNIKDFMFFVDKIKTNGLTHWFKDDPMKHWMDHVISQRKVHFYNFLQGNPRKERLAEEALKAQADSQQKVAEAMIQQNLIMPTFSGF